jgi:cyclase
MFEGASPVIFENAKRLRKRMTDAEQVLWYYLKAGINGFKFRRQHPIGRYIADIYCYKAKLIIEVDGPIHNKPQIIESDKVRQKDLEDWGYKLIRFTNQQVILNARRVVAAIEKAITGNINIQKLNASSNDGV